MCQLSGNSLKFSPNTGGFSVPNLTEFAEKITAKTKAVNVNNPNNLPKLFTRGNHQEDGRNHGSKTEGVWN